MIINKTGAAKIKYRGMEILNIFPITTGTNSIRTKYNWSWEKEIPFLTAMAKQINTARQVRTAIGFQGSIVWPTERE